MTGFMSVFYGALLVEAIVNIVRNVQAVINKYEENPPVSYWIALVLGLIAGVIVSWNYDIDLFKLVGMEGRVPVIGSLLTGLIVSRGSNVVSDVIGRINSWKRTAIR